MSLRCPTPHHAAKATQHSYLRRCSKAKETVSSHQDLSWSDYRKIKDESAGAPQIFTKAHIKEKRALRCPLGKRVFSLIRNYSEVTTVS